MGVWCGHLLGYRRRLGFGDGELESAKERVEGLDSIRVLYGNA